MLFDFTWKQFLIFFKISGFNCETMDPPVQESFEVPGREELFMFRKTWHQCDCDVDWADKDIFDAHWFSMYSFHKGSRGF